MRIAQVLLFFLLMNGAVVYGEDQTDKYKVSGIHVDVTAKDSQEARKQAFLEGEREAFKQLLNRLTRQSNLNLDITPDDIDSLNLSHTVESEKLSKVRYIADLTFHFDKEKVEQLLTEKGVEFQPYQEKSILVLPLLKSKDALLLWEPENTWFEAWADLPLSSSHVSFDLPEGNLQDIQDLSAAEAMNKNAPEIEKLSHRYRANGVVVVLCTRDAQAEDTVSSDSLTAWYVSLSGVVSSIPLDHRGEPFSSLREAALNLSKAFDSFIKEQESVDNGERSHVKAVIEIQDHSQWIAAREALTQVPLIRNLQVESLTRQQVEISFEHGGTIEALEEALRHRDFEIKSSNQGTWILIPLKKTA